MPKQAQIKFFSSMGLKPTVIKINFKPKAKSIKKITKSLSKLNVALEKNQQLLTTYNESSIRRDILSEYAPVNTEFNFENRILNTLMEVDKPQETSQSSTDSGISINDTDQRRVCKQTTCNFCI